MNATLVKNLLKMYEARKYTNIKVSPKNDENQIYIYALDKTLKIMAIILPFDCRLNIASVKSITKVVIDKSINMCSIIYNGVPTSAGKFGLQNLDGTNQVKIELFHYKRFMYHLLDHGFVVPHIKLNKQESNEIKKKFGIQLPLLLPGGVISKYYRFKPGDIIKILRKDGTIAYRIVKIN